MSPLMNRVDRQMMPPPSLGSIPPEVTLQIAEFLETKDLNSLVRSSRQFHSLLSPQLYALGAKWAPDEEGENEIITPLAWCFRNGHLTVVNQLLLKNASPTLAAGGTTAIHEVVQKDYVDELQRLLDRPYDIRDLENDLDETPLMTAARLGREACARALLDRGRGEDLDIALIFAVENSQDAMVRLILSSMPAPFEFQPGQLHLLLSSAVDVNHAGILRQLLSYAVAASAGVDINSATYAQVSRVNEVACIDVFFEYGADINFRAGWDWTFLHSAVSDRNYEATVHLLDLGADIDAVDRSGCTPLMIAAQIPAERIARLLVDRGARVEIVEEHGQNAMHMGASHGLVGLLEHLHRAGLSVHATTNDGATALHHASRSPRGEDTVKYLLGAGANISATNSVGQTPLHIAAQTRSANIARVLIAGGAPLNVTDSYSKTPLQHAFDNNDKDIIQLLRDELEKEERGKGIQKQLIKWFPKRHADGTTSYWNAGSALHDAVANGQEQNAERILARQRDIHFRDLYGRTVLDWSPVSQPNLRRTILRHWGDYPRDPDPTQQTEVLRRSITILANNILLSLSMPTRDKTVYRNHLYMLGKCLLYLGNESAARTAFTLQGTPRNRENAMYEDITCTRCRRSPTVDRGW
ncbi:ankyrin repeat-containing domain protein [Aspergillus pseudoustus]|uniref:Ankyrin repeat-containing domain protein n=1 Tax=Aspergillus pseudoustus TaxID=1810923 RepID=A0ABR4JCB2_9EURO